MTDNITFGAWLKRRRRQLDLTQQELAELAGCSVTTVRKMERDVRRPSKQLAGLLASELAIPAEKQTAFITFARTETNLADMSETLAILDDVAPESFPPSDPIRHNLPLQTTPFLGREAEIAALVGYLAEPQQRLVTIVGSGGMGKTRVALAVAEKILVSAPAHGVYFVALAPLSEPEQIVPALADALDFPLDSGGSQRRSARQQILDYLRQKEMLLVLDNFEHLLDGVELVADILQIAPQVKILVTSRERLHLQQEQVFALGGLDAPPAEQTEDVEAFTAVQLFLQSARRVKHDFQLLQGDHHWLIRICHLVGGMPLAVELAASWVMMLSLADIAQEIQQNLDILETDLHNIPSRHRSIHAVFEGSWQRLDKAEQDVLPKLSVFRGGFTRQAAQTITGASLRTLGNLVSKSLLQYSQSQDRYFVHELLRQYGAGKLKESGEETAVRDQHSLFFCTSLQQWQADLQSNCLRQTAEEIEADYRNVEVAWEYALEQGHWKWLLLAVNGLGTYFDVSGRWLKGINLFQESALRLQLNLKAAPSTAAAARLLIWLLAWQVNLDINARGELADPQSVYQQLLQPCLDLLQQPLLSDVDYRAEEAYLRLQLGRVLKYFGEHGDGLAHLTTCLRLYRELENPLGVADALYEIHFYMSDEEQARNQLQEGMALLQQADEPWRLTRLLVGMGLFTQNLGGFEEAPTLFEQAYRTAQKVGYLRGMFEARHFAISLTYELGQLDLALDRSKELVVLAQQTNDPNSQVIALSVLAMARLYGGQFILALDTFRAAMEYEREMGLPELSGGMSYFGLPQTYLHTGQYEKTLAWLKAMAYELWYLIINQMWVSLVRQDYEETLSLGQQATAKLPPMYHKGRAEIGTPAALALYELGRKAEAKRALLNYVQICLEVRVAFIQLMPLIPIVARVLADTNNTTQKERAIELWAMAQNLPFVGNSQLFADLLSQPMAEAAAALPPEAVAAAQARGRKLDWWPTAESLLEELTERGWGK